MTRIIARFLSLAIFLGGSIPIQAKETDVLELVARGDYPAALKLAMPMAERGDARAQFVLYILFSRGLSVGKDDAESIRWLVVSAQSGLPEAQVMLGIAYLEGMHGVLADEQKGLAWLEKAANGGNSMAQLVLGKWHDERPDGSGAREALTWYGKAAEQGLGLAQYELGMIYAEGDGVSVNHKQAVSWYEKAAASGVVGAQYNLGIALRDGIGAPQNFVLAHMWLNVAGSSGSSADADSARNARDRIAGKMTPSQVQESQKLAQQCLTSKFKQCG